MFLITLLYIFEATPIVYDSLQILVKNPPSYRLNIVDVLDLIFDLEFNFEIEAVQIVIKIGLPSKLESRFKIKIL